MTTSGAPQQELIFYDIRGRTGERAPSPNTGKTLLALRHKGLSFKTIYLSYPEIASFLKSRDVPPSPGDEVDWYTLPAIEYDGKIIMGSEKIADWLEKQYQDNDTPPLYPLKSKPLALLMENHLFSVRGFGLYKLVYQGILDSLDDSGREYYIRTRTELFGESVNNPPTSEEIEQIWAQVPDLSLLTAQLLQVNGEGPYFLGHTRSYADLVLVASLQARRQCNKDAFDKLLTIQPSFKILYDACQDILQD